MSKNVDLLVLGGTGQLGREVVSEAEKRGLTVVASDRRSALLSDEGIRPVEVSSPEDVTDLIVHLRPKRVINCAAFHALDQCEEMSGWAYSINAEGAANVALACKEIEAFLVQVSTDYVFGSHKAHPDLGPRLYTVDDPPSPMNVYGYTKALGEYLARRKNEGMTAIARVSFLFGGKGSAQKGGNCVLSVLEKLRKKELLVYFNDIHFTATFAKDAACHILDIDRPKIYHANNSGVLTPFDLAEEIVGFLGTGESISGFPFLPGVSGFQTYRPHDTALMPSFKGRGWKLALHAYLHELSAGTR